jgi:hypothetical protein
MSKRMRTRAGHANPTMERRRRQERFQPGRGYFKTLTEMMDEMNATTVAGIRAICREGGAAMAHIREIIGYVFVVPLNRRGRPCHSLSWQRCREMLLARKAAGIEMHVHWTDAQASEEIRHLKFRSVIEEPGVRQLIQDHAMDALFRDHPVPVIAIDDAARSMGMLREASAKAATATTTLSDGLRGA